MVYKDEVPQRCFGVVLPVAPLVRNLTIDLIGEDDLLTIWADLQMGEQSARLAVMRPVGSYEGDGTPGLDWHYSTWQSLGGDIDARFGLPAGTGDGLATLWSRITEVSDLAAQEGGLLSVIELQAELRHVLETFAEATV